MKVFTLHSAAEISAFEDEVQSMGPPWLVAINPIDNSIDINDISETLGNMISALTISVFAGSLAILGMTVYVITRSRSKEIGIYLACGEKRGAVAVQIVLEISVITLLAVGLSFLVGNSIAEYAANEMVRNDLSLTENSLGGREHWESSFRSLGITPNTVVDGYTGSFELRISPIIMAASLVIIMAIVQASTLFSLVNIFRFKPRKLLL